MKDFDENTIPGILLRGEEIGKDLHEQIEEIQALFQLAGEKKSKPTVIVLMIQRGQASLRDSALRLVRERGKLK
ncbi:MAG: hypothetical protein GWN62_16920 [Aliifodinibius sp.]|nr:hypothetical protein [Fodinibius sp.]